MTAGQTIRKLVKDGFVIKKPVKIHSRARVTRRLESKRKGRYQGTGKLAARALLFGFWHVRIADRADECTRADPMCLAQASDVVLATPACRRRCFGCAACVCCGGCSRSTVRPRRLTSTCAPCLRPSARSLRRL